MLIYVKSGHFDEVTRLFKTCLVASMTVRNTDWKVFLGREGESGSVGEGGMKKDEGLPPTHAQPHTARDF